MKKKKKKVKTRENKSQEFMILSSRIDSLSGVIESMIMDFATFATEKSVDDKFKRARTDYTFGDIVVCTFLFCFVLIVYHRVVDLKTPAAEPVNTSVTSQYPIPGIEGNFLNITELTGGKSGIGEK